MRFGYEAVPEQDYRRSFFPCIFLENICLPFKDSLSLFPYLIYVIAINFVLHVYRTLLN